jgi:acetylglutamate kinase
MDKLSVIKIGGKVIDDPGQLDSFLENFAAIRNRKILVHGGGKQIDRISEKLGIPVQMTGGRRITGSDSLEVVEMVLAGLLNKKIVSRLQSYGNNAAGLTGADGNSMLAVKRPIKDGIDFGFVGDIKKVNSGFFNDLLSRDYVPVMASLTHDGNGQMLNTNADTVAAEIAVNMTEYFDVDLVYCFDLPGVLRDINDPGSVIPVIKPSDYEKLKNSGAISKGMLPKIENALNALNRNISRVILLQAGNLGEYCISKITHGTIISE